MQTRMRIPKLGEDRKSGYWRVPDPDAKPLRSVPVARNNANPTFDPFHQRLSFMSRGRMANIRRRKPDSHGFEVSGHSDNLAAVCRRTNHGRLVKLG
jgi:hypothetical protein